MSQRPPRRSRVFRALSVACLAALCWVASPAAAVLPPELPVHRPLQLTAEVDGVSGAVVSQDGRWLAYASGRGRFRDLWLRSADPNVIVLPRQLTFDPGDDSAPAFSPDGRRLAYVGTGYDAKGDIYLLDLNRSSGSEPRRLSGRDSSDGAPAFSADGGTLYFQRARPGQAPHLAAIDLGNPGAGARGLETGGDARQPAPSPDGRWVAFVSDRGGSPGDLYLYDTKGGEEIRLTHGAVLDASPAWSLDASTLLFTRRGLDTDRDGTLSQEDNAVVQRLVLGHRDAGAHPLTSAEYSVQRPQFLQRGETQRILFLADWGRGGGGARNVWSLPVDGEIPALSTAAEQLDLARRLESSLPADPLRAALAYARVRELFSDEGAPAAQASLAIARIYQELEHPAAARSAYLQVLDHSAVAPGETRELEAAARLALARLEGEENWRSAVGNEDQAAALTGALRDIETAAAEYPHLARVQARAGVERARLQRDLGTGAAALVDAERSLDRVVEEYGDQPGLEDVAAEALLLRADVFASTGPTEEVAAAYRAVLERYPDQDAAAEPAVSRLLDLATAEIREPGERIAFLRRRAERYREKLPRLAAGTVNRVGDLRYAADEWAGAKDAYRQVLVEFPGQGSAAAAARLALAEILYREEHFRQALDLYETELQERPPADRIYRLARQGYIRKSLEAAEFLFRSGEVLSSRALFHDLARYDDSVVEAHRGVIKSAAALGELEPVLATYRRRLTAAPAGPLNLYAVGLCLTYRETREDLEQARDLIRRAIAGRGAVEYFHQTLGYVYEVLETVYDQDGQLELAAEAYRKALFLNDPKDNPGNTANLLLNLGNAQFLLNQHATAFRHYRRRAASGVPFANPETEILFYRRLGSAAFQIYEPEATVDAFEKALALLRAHADPKRSAALCDRLQQSVGDHYLDGDTAEAEPRAATLAARQADLRERLFELNRLEVRAVPSPQWDEFHEGMGELLAVQEQLNADLVSRLGMVGKPVADVERAGKSLGLQLGLARNALRTPPRLAELETELVDRLGLAYQEAGRWQDAVAAFDDSVARNQRLGLLGNLARGRRSASYSLYQWAGEEGGARRVELLRQAQQGFLDALELVRTHGIAERPEQDSDALIGVAVQVPLDESGATQAAFGFSPEQEERLAEAYLTRIATELGELDPAHEALQRQLERYPDTQEIPTGDLYGVSLLQHRAGLLAFVRGDTREAFDRFERSAKLTARLGNSASTVLNVTDMARALVVHLGRPGAGAGVSASLSRLEWTDRKAAALLQGDPTVSRQPAAVIYHTAMSAHWVELASLVEGLAAQASSVTLDLQVQRVRALQRAVGHAKKGLALLPGVAPGGADATLPNGEVVPRPPVDRATWARAARLSLNLAAAAAALDDPREAIAEHLEQALRQARAGLLPDLEWRALAGLGRLDEALEALRRTSPLRSYARAGEISTRFGAQVRELLDEEAVEEAFTLMEELAEHERVQRLAPALLGDLLDGMNPQRGLLVRTYPRLLRVEELRRAEGVADGEEETYLRAQIAREQALLDARLGAERQRAPQLASYASDPAERDAVLLLLGMAAHAEQLADQAVASADSGDRADLEANSDALAAQYRERLDELLWDNGGAGHGVLGALGPRPAEIAEVLESLNEGEALARLWDFGPTAQADARWFALVLSPDDFAAVHAATPDALFREVAAAGTELGVRTITLACEKPTRFWNLPPGFSLALSASHWLRARAARQPFRRSVLVLGPPAMAAELKGALDTGVEGDYRVLGLNAGQRTDAVRSALSGAHTLAVPQPAAGGGTVPTRFGEHAVMGPALPLESGFPLPTAALLGATPRAALAVFGALAADQLYATGHLLALAGVSTVALPRAGAAGDVAGFLASYRVLSASEAASDEWVLLGYRGMSPDEAAAFAREQFGAYVGRAKQAYQRGSYKAALGHVRDALAVAGEAPELARHRAELLGFAREAAFAAGEVTAAADYAGALVAALESSRPDSEAHADALLRHGLLLARLEAYDRAVPVLEEAVEMLANLELGEEAVRALGDMGVVLENAAEYDRALESFVTAAEFSEELEREDLLALQQRNIGRLYDLRLSRWARAKQSYLRALDLFDASGDLGGVIQALVDVGRCERLLGNFPQAEERYSLALELLEEEPTPILTAKVVIEQANNAWFQGRYQEAFELQQQVLATARAEGWPLGEVLARNTAGLTWWTLGDNPRALRELEQALERARQLPSRADEVATSLNNIGLVHREAGRYEKALETLHQALEIDRRLGSRWAIAYDLRNIGLTLLRRGDAEDSLEYLEEAAEAAAAIGDRVNQAKALLALAEARGSLEESPEARRLFEDALALSRGMALRETEWRALHGLAKLHLADGELHSARELLFDAVAVVEGMRAEIKLEQLRDGFLANKLDVYQLLVRILVDQDAVGEAFSVAERSRSRNFIDLLGSQRLTLRGAVEQAAYDRQQELKARTAEQETLLAQAEEEDEQALYRDAVQELRDAQRDHLLQIQIEHPGLASLVSVEPVRADQVRELLEPGVVLLAYYLLPDQALCWVLETGRVSLVRTPIDRAALGEEIFAFRRRTQNLEPVEAASVALHRQLVQPLQRALDGATHLGIIPHGPLHYLSFATLSDGQDYLVDRHPLFYLPSASVFGYTLQRRQAEPNRRVLALGNPDLGTSSLELPFAEQEVGTIHWNFPDVTTLTGEGATESWVVRHLGEFGIIHLASHGEFDPVNPLFSALKLAQDQSGDGDLHASEVFALEINADLVVLSACQTGLGKVTAGDDVIGLNRAFFYAGTHAIVSSLWRVSDVSTAVLMKQFYRQYAQRNKADSLRAAMLHVKNRYPHPGYWGAFTLSGDYQ